MKKIKNRRFSDMIVIMPACIIIFMFSLIFFSFHLIINQHIGSLTQENIKIEFEIMDAIFEEEKCDDYVTWGMDDESIMIPVEYMILDDANHVIFSSEYFFLQRGMDTAEFLAQYIDTHKIPLYRQTAKVAIDDKTYLISAKYYEGVYRDDFVKNANL